MIGRTLAHYKILEKIGSGGMGDVYLAEDTKLDRKIALKVLPPELAENEERRARFQREAKAIAALNHPNIVQVFSVEETDGIHFITMELVHGKTLTELLPKNGFPLNKFFDIGIPLAEAVAAAHEAGIIHRDLKPGNVMVTDDGRVKVFDFGLAKMETPSPRHDLDSEVLTEARTQEGAIVGTFPYMSPEQAQGGRVDSRSDIFSLGVILYEMAAGRRPFRGDSTVSLLSSILKDDPPSVDGLPRGLQYILERCLAKDPDARYRNGDEVSHALSTAGAEPSAPTSEVPWIVVRPFKARMSDEELVSFAEGLTEDVNAGLALFSHLSVIEESSERAGDECFAVEGALRKSGTKVRVSIKLIDFSTGAHLWAEQFDRDLGTKDIFAAQDELTDRIVATVADPNGVLSRSLIALVRKKLAMELTAHECVLRVFGYLQQWRRDEHRELRDALEVAVEREPDHAGAWACLSGLYLDEHRYYYNRQPDPLDRALTAAHRAVELDATSQLAYRALAEVHFFRRELSAFRSAASRALALNRRDTSNVAMVGTLLSYSGAWDEGRSIIEKAMEMNPHHAGWLYFQIAWDHYRKREYEQAIAAAEMVNMSGYMGSYVHLTICHAQLGNIEAAKKHLDGLLALSPRYGQIARRDLTKWFVSEELVEHALEGLVKAGLDIPDRESDSVDR